MFSGLDAFNAAPTEEIRSDLLACCDVPAWADAVLADRPYADADAALQAADAAARRIDLADVDRALARHPRIGERAAGADAGAAWSRREQSGVDRDAGTRAALAAGNRAYEERFGRVFLTCASGRSSAEILAELRERLDNDPGTEASVVGGELRKIALLRLGRLLQPGDQEIREGLR